MGYRLSRFLAIILAVLFLTSCVGEMQDVSTSRSIFLQTPRGATVYVDIRNTSQAQNFPLQSQVIEILKSKGYKITNDSQKADITLRANILYSGLSRDINTGTGAGIGAGAGALAGVAVENNGSGSNYAGAALIGSAAGAAIGYAIEQAATKSTFISVVDVIVVEKSNPFPHTTTVTATLRQQSLKMQQAVNMMSGQIATQVGGIF